MQQSPTCKRQATHCGPCNQRWAN